MNNPAQFDHAALAIVKPGVDGGLLELQKQLEKFWADPSGQADAIQSAQSEAKRLSGVFKMVGLEGLAVYCAEIEALLSGLASHPASSTAVHREGVDAALQALAEYLDDIAQGADNATLRLFPKYQQLQHIRGLEMSFELDMFFPNLNVDLPASVSDPVRVEHAQAQIRVARSQYQQGLLGYLRQTDVSLSLRSMQQAMLDVMATVPGDRRRAYWWVAAGLFGCLDAQNLPAGLNVSKLLGRIDQQIRALSAGKAIEEQPELYQMLYVIARSEKASGGIPAAINQTYALQRYIQDNNRISPSLLNKRLSVLGEHLRTAQASWDACVGGDPAECVTFISQAELMKQYCEKLDPDTLQVLARAIAEYAQHANKSAQALSLDMAMALLLMDRGLSGYHQIDSAFQQQCLLLSERMHSAIHSPARQDKSDTELSALYCDKESALVRTLLGKEMLGNLQRVESGLNAYFQDADNRDELRRCLHDIKQIEGGLHILGLEPAAALTQAFQQAVERLAKDEKPVERATSRTIANALSVLEDYLAYGPRSGPEQDTKVRAATVELGKLNQGMLSSVDITAAVPAYKTAFDNPSDEDRELMGIFLEEADEVLAIMRDNLELCRLHETGQAALITIRRGFHTLKGSGRMVGLNDLGEVAWALEQAMNAWLENEQPVTDALLEMIAMAIPKFSHWVDMLRRQGSADIDGDDLVRAARQIEAGQGAAGGDANPDDAEQDAMEREQALDAEVIPAVPESGEPMHPAASQPDDGSVEAESLNLVQVGAISLSAALFKIGSEESKQHVAILQSQHAALSAAAAPHIEYDFMRAAHTLAGVNRAMGFAAIVELAFALERWLQVRMEHPFTLHSEQLELLRAVIASLAQMVQDVCAQRMPEAANDLVQLLSADKDGLDEPVAAIETAPETQPPATIAEKPSSQAPLVRDEVDEQLVPVFLEEAADLVPQIGTHLRAWREQPADVKPVQELNRLLHTLKGSARMAGAMRIGQVAHEMEDAVLLAEKRQKQPAYWDELDHEFDRITALLGELRTGKTSAESVDVADARQRATDHIGSEAAPDRRMLEIGAERALQGNMLRVRADVIDRLVNEASEISVARARMEGELRIFKDGLLELTESVVRLRKQLREVEIQAESQMQARVSLLQDSDEQFDPLEFDRFTRLQELTRFMNESVHDVQTVQQTLLKNLDETTAAMSAQARLNRELQQGLMNVRMVPFNSITDRLYRIVRQTGKELNKRANLELLGTAVELDRSVLEKMTAPFEHLLRNAIAHGLENEQQRNQMGKQPIGEIRLSLRQENNEVVFELSDDGAGLNFPLLREKAIGQGLLKESDAVTEEQLAQLIFTTGISTANEVTEVAGRGIGMDVVRSEITALGGRIDVSSRSGTGTRFIIHLPLTLAVTQVLMVRSGSANYAIPATMVEQVRQVKSAEMEELYRAGHIEWQGKPYPLHYLPRLLGAGEQVAETQARNAVLLLRSGELRMALHIEELLGNQEAVVKNIGPQLAHLPGIAGATVRGNGEIVLILNPLQISQRISSGVTDKAETAELPRRLPVVMVVDDSLTVRKITTRMLTRAGYAVVTAKDGVDALEQVADVMPEVMLLDVEMPRMDGFELTKQLRLGVKTKNIPIIMITSRTADKHRDHAMQLGVNAYLGKPYQEDDLLARIAGFVANAHSL